MRPSFAAVLILTGSLAALPVLAQRQPVGAKIEIRPDELPAPNATPSVGNSPRRLPLPREPHLQLPPGFVLNRFAGGLSHARNLIVAPNGDVLLAESESGRITLLRDSKGSGEADQRAVFATGLDMPHGLALRDGYLYVGEVHQIRRIPYQLGMMNAAGPAEDVTAHNSLGAFSPGHWTRNIAFSADGKGFYVTVGSRSNVDEEPPPYATVQWFRRDGSGQRTYASGLRNPVGIAVNPATGVPWVVVNERDGLGDGLVPDYLTGLREGAFYGWPYAYTGAHADPDWGRKRPDLVPRSAVGDVLFTAHSAPLGLAFYDGAMFPPEYKGDAFVSFHGSWNSARPTGYMIVRVRFKDGRQIGRASCRERV